MKKCKRFLAILLAMLMIGGAATVAASAAEENNLAWAGAIPSQSSALQAVAAQEVGEEPPEPVELTDEQALEMMAIIVPMLIVFRHMASWGRLPGFLVFKSGKNFYTFLEEITAYEEALEAENGWGIGTKTYAELYLDGVLEDFVTADVAAYAKTAENNLNFLANLTYSFFKWFYGALPPSIAYLLLLSYTQYL